MGKKRRKKRAPKQFKSAFVSVSDAELGWSGPTSGRTVTIVFYDGKEQKVGTLRISAAGVRWWGPHGKRCFEVRSTELDELFRD
jgi:hypothetical protein